MPIALEVTIISVLVALAVGLVPLLFQLRWTAKEVEVFLLSSRKDLTQIAEDVHASRLRMDHLANTLQASLDELTSFIQAMGEVGRAVNGLHARLRNTIESASRNFGGILGGISAVMAFFKNKQTSSEPKKEQQP